MMGLGSPLTQHRITKSMTVLNPLEEQGVSLHSAHAMRSVHSLHSAHSARSMRWDVRLGRFGDGNARSFALDPFPATKAPGDVR